MKMMPTTLLLRIQESQDPYPESLPKEFIIATALRLTRYLAY